MTRHTPIPAARSPEEIGRSPAGRAAAASAVEPVSAVSSKASIPNAVPTLSVQLTDDLDPNAVGELLLSYINDRARWGYMTRDFLRGDFREVAGVPPLDVRTLCCGCFAKCECEYRGISWWRSHALNLDLYLYWDGDGTIVFQHPAWTLENTDCKKSYKWEWAHLRGHWARDLPADYYDECEPYLRLKCGAQAIEARRAETVKQGSVHESAVPEGNAPNE